MKKGIVKDVANNFVSLDQYCDYLTINNVSPMPKYSSLVREAFKDKENDISSSDL